MLASIFRRYILWQRDLGGTGLGQKNDNPASHLTTVRKRENSSNFHIEVIHPQINAVWIC